MKKRKLSKVDKNIAVGKQDFISLLKKAVSTPAVSLKQPVKAAR
jgi:hypothetical protein